MDDRDVLRAPRHAAALRPRARAARLPRLPPLGVRERSARPRAPPGGAVARRRCRPLGAAADLRRLDAAGEPPTTERLRAWLEYYPSLRFKLDATPDWTDELILELEQTGAVDSVDFKGQYHGTSVDTVPDPELYKRIVAGLPHAWLEDPALTPETEAVLEPHHERITWDAVIHSVADIEALRWPPKTVNVKPSRFGSVERLFAAYDYCEAHEIGAYGGGQFELGVGRDQIQLLAALFHPGTPNDVAPGGFNVDPQPGLASSPLTVVPARSGSRTIDRDRRRRLSLRATSAGRRPTRAAATRS